MKTHCPNGVNVESPVSTPSTSPGLACKSRRHFRFGDLAAGLVRAATVGKLQAWVQSLTQAAGQ